MPLWLVASAQALPSRRGPSPIERPVFNCTDIEPRSDYTNFEAGQVRPLALSSDDKLLFVANTPANCLEIFSTRGGELERVSAVQVGLAPVAVALKDDHEVWVVNQLSDSISIVDLSFAPTVKRTLQVGDEPRDITFAGIDNERAFITTAHRGQSNPAFALEDLRTPGLGRADVWVFDANDIGEGLSGQPASILTLFTDAPRALTVSRDKQTVYAAGFLTGNQTTTLAALTVLGAKPPPYTDINGAVAPDTGLIVKFDGNAWMDEAGTDWSSAVHLSLPDKDVFAIDAVAASPSVAREFAHVGTVLFNMAVNPVTGSLYVSNTEALNQVRFEGPGSDGNTTVRGHFVENRITVIQGDDVRPVHLNPHVDFGVAEGETIPADEKEKSIAQPLEMQVSRDGSTVYVAGFGSGKIVAIPAAALEAGTYTPDAARQISVPDGPTGLVLDSRDRRLFVYSRFDNVVSIVNTRTHRVVESTPLYQPEPEYVTRGRTLLYDADLTSSNGTVSCASCHIFGDLDALAWDLGNPSGAAVPNPLQPVNTPIGNPSPLVGSFHPLKGPMLTQTLRGIADGGPMHWRGDRTGVAPELVDGSVEPQAAAAFKEFNPAFVGLLGREHELSAEDMQAFTDFALSIQPPPNPIRNIDDTLTETQAAGRDVYFDFNADFGLISCNDCHTLDTARRQFGTAGLVLGGTLSGFGQDFEIPGFRNIYQRVGMFGGSTSSSNFGDQIRGFGFIHDGSTPTPDDFVFAGGFIFADEQQGVDVVDFLMAYDTNHAPVVGQQVTLPGPGRGQDELERLELLLDQAILGNCRLEAHGALFGRGYDAALPQDPSELAASVLAQASRLQRLSRPELAAITFTCGPL